MNCPSTVPLTSSSDIKSWTARSPTASTPHSHALNRPREDPLLCGLRRSDRLSQRLHPPTRLGRQHGMGAPHESSVHRVFSPFRLQTRMSALACAVTISHLLRDALHLPEGHPRRQRVHRQSDARCDPCVVSGEATTHTLSAT
ncbi:hypothetical protein WA556_005775 [Blastocystis sp. ATCC 50177/Nand II]